MDSMNEDVGVKAIPLDDPIYAQVKEAVEQGRIRFSEGWNLGRPEEQD